jgi:hypothetical protein
LPELSDLKEVANRIEDEKPYSMLTHLSVSTMEKSKELYTFKGRLMTKIKNISSSIVTEKTYDLDLD